MGGGHRKAAGNLHLSQGSHGGRPGPKKERSGFEPKGAKSQGGSGAARSSHGGRDGRTRAGSVASPTAGSAPGGGTNGPDWRRGVLHEGDRGMGKVKSRLGQGEDHVSVMVDGKKVKAEDTIELLGVSFDRKLSTKGVVDG